MPFKAPHKTVILSFIKPYQVITRIFEFNLDHTVHVSTVLLPPNDTVIGTMYWEEGFFTTVSYIYNSLN